MIRLYLYHYPILDIHIKLLGKSVSARNRTGSCVDKKSCKNEWCQQIWRCVSKAIHCPHHQRFQEPKMTVLKLVRLFCGCGFPSISLTYSLYRGVPSPFWGFEVINTKHWRKHDGDLSIKCNWLVLMALLKNVQKIKCKFVANNIFVARWDAVFKSLNLDNFGWLISIKYIFKIFPKNIFQKVFPSNHHTCEDVGKFTSSEIRVHRGLNKETAAWKTPWVFLRWTALAWVQHGLDPSALWVLRLELPLCGSYESRLAYNP